MIVPLGIEDRWSGPLTAAATLVLGLGLLVVGVAWSGGGPTSSALAATAGEGDGAAAPTGEVLELPDDAPPARLRIDAVEVDERLTELGLTADRAMEVPAGEAYDLPGWYRHGPRPGELGPAVVGGHVDSRDGPSIFHRLDELRPGDEVEVGYGDGTVARFVVHRTERHSKEAFPFEEVFGDTDTAALRLITCGGAFDRGARSYDDNLVVFASFVDAHTPDVSSAPAGSGA